MKRTFAAWGLLFAICLPAFAAEDGIPASAPTATTQPAKGDEVICERESSSDSRIKKRTVCRTRDQRETDSRESREYVQSISRSQLNADGE